MIETKKSGKAALRGVDGRKATGVCAYSMDRKGLEATLTLQIPDAKGTPQAVLQLGADKGYRCLPPAPATGALRCGEQGVAAVWVLDAGKPAMLGVLGGSPFDAAEARRKLAESLSGQSNAVPAAKAVPSVPAEPAEQFVRPAYREPAERPTEPFQAGAEPGAPSEAAIRPQGEEGIVRAASVAEAQRDAPEPMNAVQPPPVRQPAWRMEQPLVVKRAPRPTPGPPVYSPLWDDVSAEFEKMLDTLPRAQPFNGSAGDDAEIAEMPTDNAVQCYIGSVVINGMKVFLQAVPARPYARPAGFDHSLVSREGHCYWVKYFIQNE